MNVRRSTPPKKRRGNHPVAESSATRKITRAPGRTARGRAPAQRTRPSDDAIAIDLNRVLLNRYRFVEHETLRVLAGWMPKIGRFELKCEAGRAIWESALHVNAYYLRLREIQSPAFQNPDDPALTLLMSEMPHAPDEFALALAFHQVILPDLIQALENHETATFPNSDLPSVHAIRHTLLDLRAQADRLRPLIAEAARGRRITAQARAWERYVRQLLAAAGGVDGLRKRSPRPITTPECRAKFTSPREAARDERFTHPGADLSVLPGEEDHENHTAMEFERYSTEMLAAETVAVVLNSVRGMPWEFEYDTARHLYDEVRHCLMGFEWMRRHDKDPFKSPQFLQVFRWRTQFPPVTQYCMLTMGNEVHAFPYRHRRVAAHQKSADRLSEQFVRYDIADETQHVRFGKRWLPELIKHTGDKRPPDRFVEDALEIWNTQYKTGKLPINLE